MQIQLTQVEIVTAIKQYIEAKGIALQSKEVDISFTAGRKGTGLSAIMSIEDAGIPEFESADDDQVGTPATVTPIRAKEQPPVEAKPAVGEPPQGDAPAPELKTASASLFS